MMDKTCLRDAVEHMEVLNLLREEFEHLQQLWLYIYKILLVHAGIYKAKLRCKHLGEELLEADNDPHHVANIAEQYVSSFKDNNNCNTWFFL